MYTKEEKGKTCTQIMQRNIHRRKYARIWQRLTVKNSNCLKDQRKH